MRESFEKDLLKKQYNELAKTELSSDTTEEEYDSLQKDLEGLFEAVTEAEHARSTNAQEHIYALQKKKRELLDDLHEKLRAIDDPHHHSEQRPYEQFVTIQNDTLCVYDQNLNTYITITEGELLTDGEWGRYYYLDPENVPRSLRKRYVIEDVRRKIFDLFDEQIITHEKASGYVDPFKKKAYEAILQERGDHELSGGIIAEKMVRNFLKKLTYDHPGVEFDIERADVYQDVEHKVDFIIRKKERSRGVGVDVSEVRDAIGVQFTGSTDPDILSHKEGQLSRARKYLGSEEKLDDIVLVTIPLSSIITHYNTWNEDPAPGGPDKLWPNETKHTVFSTLLQGMFDNEEIEERWKKVERLI